MNFMTRRAFAGRGLLTFAALGLNPFLPSWWQRQLLAGTPDDRKKLIFIFQTGGNDGLNTVIPRGDPDYSPETRPSLFLPQNLGLDSGNGFAQFHPRLQPLMEIYNRMPLNGQPGPGNLAVLHRVGYSGQSQSHFDSQQYWQNGVPGNSKLEEGMFYRHLALRYDLTRQENSLLGVAIDNSQIVALKGEHPVPNFTRAEDFGFYGTAAKVSKYVGRLPSTPQGGDGAGLLGLYGGAPDDPAKPYRSLVYSTGQLLGATIGTLRAAVAQGTYVPENGAVYPNTSLGRRLQQAAMLLKRTPVKVIGLNTGGWDTHTNQGQVNGAHGDLLASLAQGLQALYRDLQAQWGDLIIVTMTEFGRTSKENGSSGTDHADSSVMFVAGGSVKGGVYNCDANTWKQGDMFSKSNRYLARRTDFRAVFGEIFTRHFRDPQTSLEQIIPGYGRAAAQNPGTFQDLNFLPV
jgi:uncharacterized protein (DUF1501 family)